MKLALPVTLAVAFMAPRGVVAWDNLGHETTGQIGSRKNLPCAECLIVHSYLAMQVYLSRLSVTIAGI